MVDPAICTFRVTFKPKIYRDIEIAGTKSLYELAVVIVRAFAFDLDHAFGFYSKPTIYDLRVKYELFVDMDDTEESDARSLKKTPVAEAFPDVGHKMTFLYDYGDEWRFGIALTGRNPKQKGVKYPRVAASVGEAPEQYPDPDDE